MWSSWYTSSPNDAVAMAASMDGVGVVKVSLRNSFAAGDGDALGVNILFVDRVVVKVGR
jgi:hypothetical protein